jgi:hypothetical protein
MGFKEIWRDPVWSKVISAAIIAIAAVVGTFLLALFSQPVSTGLAHGWTYVAADAMVPRWLLGLLILSALATAVWIAIITIARLRASPDAWLSYTEDEFHFVQWRWDLDKEYGVSNIRGFCPACDFELDVDVENTRKGLCTTTYRCPCQQISMPFHDNPNGVHDRVKKTVEQRIRNGEWKNAERH